MQAVTAADRVPPNNLDAERAVLGAALIDREALMYIVESLRPADFYSPHNGTAFGIMSDMAKKEIAVDSISFQNELLNRGMIDNVGGYSFVASLLDSVTTTANAEHHCRIIKDKAMHRELIGVASDIARLGFSEDVDAFDAAAEAERMVFKIAGDGTRNSFKNISDVVYDTFAQIENRISHGMVENAVASGFDDLDKLTGGFQPGSLNIIAARPSMGKTAFALNIAQKAAIDNGVNVLLFSMEMSAEQLAGRLLSSEARVNTLALQNTMREVQKSQWTDLTEAAAKLSGAPIFIDDSSMLSAMELRAKCRRFFSRHRGERSLVIVDYLQLMTGSGMSRTENRQQEVADISRALKSVAREFEVPVISLAQLNRAVESRPDKRPQLADLRESGAIEQDADIVAFLYRKGYYQQDNEQDDPSAELRIAKHRNGMTGTVSLVFYKEISRFESMARQFGPHN